MNFKGQAVRHITFGDGKITGCSGNILTVSFGDLEKRFIYPDAFSKFLSFVNTKNQEKAEKDLTHAEYQKRAIDRTTRNIRKKKFEIAALPKSPDSQIAFNVDYDGLGEIMEKKEVFTGCYMSGKSEGVPRQPKRLQAHSAGLLTYVPHGGTEEHRRIAGIFMVPVNFKGEECADGVIKFHPKFSLLLPDNRHLAYWQYVTDPKKGHSWGKVRFKYFNTMDMKNVIRKLTEICRGTEEGDLISDLYHHFCQVNDLDS